eukprot:UN01752
MKGENKFFIFFIKGKFKFAGIGNSRGLPIFVVVNGFILFDISVFIIKLGGDITSCVPLGGDITIIFVGEKEWKHSRLELKPSRFRHTSCIILICTY